MRRSGPIQRKTPLERTTAWPAPATARSRLHANQGAQRHQPKRRAAKHTGPSEVVVKQVGERDEWRCFRCGTPCDGRRGVDWSVQHRRARGMGGTRRPDTNEPQSLILLCGSATTGCHGWVESNRTAALSNGWAVKSNSNPLQVPVLHWQRGLIFLTADGGYPSAGEEAIA